MARQDLAGRGIWRAPKAPATTPAQRVGGAVVRLVRWSGGVAAGEAVSGVGEEFVFLPLLARRSGRIPGTAFHVHCPECPDRHADLVAIVGGGALGSRLAGTGNLDERGFSDCVRLSLAPVYLRLAQQLRKTAERWGGGRGLIAAGLTQIETACLDLENRVDSLGPADRAQVWGEAQALARFRSIVKRFGERLCAWPHLVQTARRLSLWATTASAPEGLP